MDTLNDEILKTIECPVCLQYPSPPIIMCPNGHNLCLKCRKKLTSCPTCREGFSHRDLRNRALENLALLLKLPCKFQKNGCERELLRSEVQSHQRSCLFRNYCCLVEECEFSGQLHSLVGHIKGVHKVFLTNSLISFDKPKEENYFYFKEKEGEMFYGVRDINVNEEMTSWIVWYVGPPDKAEQFEFQLTFKSIDNRRTMVFTNITFSYGEKEEEIIKSERSIDLSFRLLEPFGNDVELHITKKA